MPNRSDEYIKEMNSLTFSDDIKERIMSNILRYKEKSRKMHISMVILLFLGVCIIVAVDINAPDDKGSELVYRENIEGMNNVSGVKDFKVVKVDLDNHVESLEINPEQMVILNIQNMQGNVDSLGWNGRLTGEDREYSFGYIEDKAYIEVLSDCTDEYISHQVAAKGGTKYGIYIINQSEHTLTFSGNIFTSANDLVYRDYGSEVLQAEGKCRLIIDLNGLSGAYNVEGVYIYDYITHRTIRRDFSYVIEYESEQGGVFHIYALTVEGEQIELSENVVVEYIANENSGIIGL